MSTTTSSSSTLAYFGLECEQGQAKEQSKGDQPMANVSKTRCQVGRVALHSLKNDGVGVVCNNHAEGESFQQGER
jgi:hypothetical protein